jgi:hypothetical protein
VLLEFHLQHLARVFSLQALQNGLQRQHLASLDRVARPILLAVRKGQRARQDHRQRDGEL